MKLLERPHLIRFVGGYFDEGKVAVILAGKSGIGKSVLAQQLAHERSGPTLIMKVGDESRWEFDPTTAMERLVDQIRSILSDATPGIGDELELAEEYFRQVNRVARVARANGEKILFIVDGLESLGARNSAAFSDLMRLVPFAKDQFQFLIAGFPRESSLPQAIRERTVEFTPPPFSLDEIKTYLATFSPDEALLQTVVRVSGGLPDRLSIIYRLLRSTKTGNDPMVSLPDSLESLQELEWLQNAPFTEIELLALAIMLEEPALGTLSVLSDVLECQPAVLQRVEGFSFLVASSEPFRFQTLALGEFVADKTRAIHDKAVDACVRFMQRNLEAGKNFERLTDLFARTNQSENVLKLLSDEKFAGLVGRSGSFSDLRRASERGIGAALDVRRPADALRFSFQRAMLAEYVADTTTTSELRAMVALGQTAAAMARAEAERLVEAKFRMLCAIARACKELTGKVPDDVSTTVRAVFADLPAQAYGEEAVSVASDLLFAAPDLATALLTEKAMHVAPDNRLDVAFATLAFESRAADLRGGDQATVRSFEERVEHPGLRRVLTAAAISSSDLPAAAAIERVERIASIADRIFVLESWMLANRTRGDSLEILDYALKTCVASAGYTASARTYRRLTRCLLFHPTLQQLSYFIQLVDAQLSNLERIGPEHEYHRLLVQLGRAVWRFDQVAGRERFLAAYVMICGSRQPLDRAAGLARLLSTLAQVDPTRTLDEGDKLHESVASDLDVEVEELLRGTAEHREALEEVITALSGALPERAIDLCGRLNLLSRRDRAFAEFAGAHLRGSPTSWSFPHVKQATLAIENPANRDGVIERLSEAIQLRGVPDDTQRTLEAIDDIVALAPNPRVRAEARAQVARAVARAGATVGAKRLLERAAADARLLHSPTERREARLEVASLAAAIDREWASAELAAINAEDDGGASAVSSATSVTLRLAIRASVGLIRAKALSDQMLRQLMSEIAQLPSPGNQVMLLSQLCVACSLGGAEASQQEVVRDSLLRHLSSIPVDDVRCRTNAIVSAAPALFLANASSVLTGYLDELAGHFRDHAIWEAARAVRLEIPPADPFEEIPGASVTLTHAQAVTIIELAQRTSSDGLAFTLLESVIQGIGSAAARDILTASQRAELVSRIETTAARAFPSKRNIKHEGYRVCIDALLDWKLRPSSQRLGYSTLEQRAKSIPNAADAAFVRAYVVAYGHPPNLTRAVEEARKACLSLIYLGDRIDRLESLARLIAPSDAGRAKSILQEALTLAAQGEHDSFEERRRSLISLAHRVDASFGNALTVLSDDDPAKRRVEQARRVEELREKVREKDFGTVCAARRSDLVEVAWELLGALHANRTKPVQREFLMPAIERALELPIDAAYPLFSLAIESEVRRCASRPKSARDLLEPVFFAALGATGAAREALARLDRRVKRHLEPARSPGGGIDEDADVTVVAGQGGYGVAVKRIEEWLLSSRPAELLISEPYFDHNLLRLLALVGKHENIKSVTIITSRRTIRKEFGADYDEAIREEWWRLSADPPPPTTVIVASYRGGELSPVHDRWWLSETSGLQLGSSAGGLSGRVTTIRELTGGEVAEVRSTLETYSRRTRLFLDGERINYSLFEI